MFWHTRLSSSLDGRPDVEHEVGPTCGPQHGFLVNINDKAWSLFYLYQALRLHSITLHSCEDTKCLDTRNIKAQKRVFLHSTMFICSEVQDRIWKKRFQLCCPLCLDYDMIQYKMKLWTEHLTVFEIWNCFVLYCLYGLFHTNKEGCPDPTLILEIGTISVKKRNIGYLSYFM